MNLQEFFHYVHNGAFTLFESIIHNLTIAELKALRLCLSKTLADSIFPHMFSRLYFSIHDEDLEAFNNVARHTLASRRITDLFWEGVLCRTFITEDERGKCSPERMLHLHLMYLLRDRGVALSETGTEYNMLNKQLREQQLLYTRANDFWLRKERAWTRTFQSNADLIALKTSLGNLPNLRRITLMGEDRCPCVPHDHYTRFWDSPRARLWARLPFSQFLFTPRPKYPGDQYKGFVRALDCIATLCQEERIEVGALIIDAYGRGQLLDQRNRMDVELQPFREFGSVIHGPGSRVPDLIDNKKLTLRLIIEIPRPQKSLWQSNEKWRPHLDAMTVHCQNSLEEVSYCRVDIKALIDFHNDSRNKEFCHLSDCRKLRRIRFYYSWCPDVTQILRWIWRNTPIREVEFDNVTCKYNSWFATMTELKRENLTFDFFEVRSCRSKSEFWGPGFEAAVLAPWNGESRNIVPWLRGETSDFPLWQGPG